MNTRWVVGLRASIAVAQDGYAAAIPVRDALCATRTPTTLTPKTPTAISAMPRTGAGRRVVTIRPDRARRAPMDSATPEAMASQGGTITATQIGGVAYGRESERRAHGSEREVAQVEVTSQSRSGEHCHGERRE